MDFGILELSIIPLTRIILQFFILLIWAPMLFSFDRRKLDFYYSTFRYLVQGIFFAIVTTYFLTFVKLYEVISFFLAYVGMGSFFLMQRLRANRYHDEYTIKEQIAISVLRFVDLY